MNPQDFEQLTLFPVDSRDCASRSVWPGSDGARRMTVTSGRKCLELSRNSGPLGSLEKMLLGSSAWRSTRCYLTWKVSATPAKRLLFRLVPSMPRTGGTDAPLWLGTMTASQTGGTHALRSPERREGRTPSPAEFVMMWPTPNSCTASMDTTLKKSGDGRAKPNKLGWTVAMFPTPTRFDAECGDLKGKEYNGKSRHAMKLIQAAKLLPTPIASDWKNRGCRDYRKNREHQLQTEVGGQLNPTWVEWLMGFPLGWTDLDA